MPREIPDHDLNHLAKCPPLHLCLMPTGECECECNEWCVHTTAKFTKCSKHC